MFAARIWHQRDGISPQEIDFNNSITTNNNSKHDKIVWWDNPAKWVTDNGNSVAFFHLIHHAHFRYDKQKSGWKWCDKGTTTKLIRENSLFTLFGCSVSTESPFCWVYFYVCICFISYVMRDTIMWMFCKVLANTTHKMCNSLWGDQFGFSVSHIY